MSQRMNSPTTSRRGYSPSPLRGGSRRLQAGLTLIELLVVMVMTALLASALGYAFTATLTVQRLQDERRAGRDRTDATEREITRLLQGARLADAPAPAAPGTGTPGTASGGTADVTTYFIGTNDRGAVTQGCSRLTFTTTAPGVPLASLSSTDPFEDQQRSQGPVGGLAEVSLGTDPVGDAGGRAGLFERLQRPGDGDPTQGGTESVLDPQVAAIGFQFWDGVEWLTTWDTASGPRRLPAAVEVTYTLRDDPDNTAHFFVVPLPASDVTAQNPAAPGGSP
ncbi:MAG: prepilin-type N-terminal cleavage/methylation domain-containing protein [Armatimonadetes bacterium]|nr:prepilin-type N-terminal cleavage/methylation domain-containing protein [Armatimonadota bacterium]